MASECQSLLRYLTATTLTCTTASAPSGKEEPTSIPTDKKRCFDLAETLHIISL